MADSHLVCDGCQHFVGCCVETLPCGHYFCGVCSCNMEGLNTLCMLCEGCETEECDMLSSCEETTGEKDFLVNSGTLVVLDSNFESNKQIHETEIEELQHVIDEEHFSGDLKDNLLDDALVFANDTLCDLNKAIQTLKKIETRNTILEENISVQINEEFNKLSYLLTERKSALFAQLRKEIDVYNANLSKAVEAIEEHRSSLEKKVAFAEGLKNLPNVSVYCDLNQLFADLKVYLKNEDMMKSLTVQPSIRFSMHGEKIINILGTAGKIYCDSPDNCLLTLDESNVLPTKMEASTSEVYSINRNGMGEAEFFKKNLVQEYELESTNQLHSESNGSDHQMLSLLPFKINPLAQEMSSPDVIIEEIIDDQQSFDPQGFSSHLCHNKMPYSKKLSYTEFSGVKSKKFKKNQKKIGSKVPFCQKKGCSDLVYLSHVVSPCNFYVHRLEHKRQLIMLEHKLSTRSRIHRQCSPHDVFELGEIVCFRSIERGAWCRGRISKLIPSESQCVQKHCGPTRYRVEDISRLTIFLLDYGSSEIFIVARFARVYFRKGDLSAILQTKIPDLCPVMTKLISPDDDNLRLAPPFALHCSLDVASGAPDGTWTKEAKDQILSVVKNKCVQMKVIREENRMLIIDLKKPGEKKITSDMPVSLRESLIFLDLAKFPYNIVNAAAPHYREPVLPQNTTEAIVIVCHMNNPSDFYIHVIGCSEYREVVDKIQDVYNSEEADDLRIVSPLLGQACVAKYEVNDDSWYRAEIIGLPNASEAEIKYVDFGNVNRVNVAKLRMLKDEFLALPRKAICCRLAFIEPFHDTIQWSSEACNLFDRFTSCKHLKCSSIGVFLENKLSVELFDCSSQSPTSVNNILVKEHVASFIDRPLGTDDTYLPLNEIWDLSSDQPQDFKEKCMDELFLFERKELDVYISHVVSPSKIFVQWLSTEDILKSLERNMFEKYENSKLEITDWQIDMHVAVQLPNDKKWLRGKITGIISEKLVEVFCYDFGKEEAINVANLRTLDESLKIYGATCLECSLMDIQPAGGCNNWTATACDFICYYLTGATATMIMEENASRWPLPVRILSKNEAGQLVDVSDLLINKGLALRDRRLRQPNPLMEINETRSVSSMTQDSEKGDQAQSKLDINDIPTKDDNTTISDESTIEVNIGEPYLPPVIPSEKLFLAKVSHVADNGTIYVMQECLENELGMLMLDIQNSFKGLGLIEPYDWKKGEGCLIKGSDTMFYRGKVLEILGGDLIKVQYEDFGYTEQIPKCHLYPVAFSPSIRPFCIPCLLNDILPVGDHWQQDAIQFLNELLKDRYVNVHLVDISKFPGEAVAVYLYCGNTSVSAILEQHAHCIPKDCDRKTKIEIQGFTKMSYEKKWCIDFQELLQSDWVTPILPQYSLSLLPSPGERFAIQVTHLQTPDLVFLCIENRGINSQLGDLGDDVDHEGECDPLKLDLNKINNEADSLLSLTDFRTGMPCLAIYHDRCLHRAKLVSLKGCNPVTFVVEFVDYGSTAVLETSCLFQLPAHFIQFPAKAIKVNLAGFKPPKEDFEEDRLPYKPEWSLKALYEMIDLVQGRTLSATCLAGSPENTVFVYDEKQQLVYKPLIRMGLADKDSF